MAALKCRPTSNDNREGKKSNGVHTFQDRGGTKCFSEATVAVEHVDVSREKRSRGRNSIRSYSRPHQADPHHPRGLFPIGEALFRPGQCSNAWWSRVDVRDPDLKGSPHDTNNRFPAIATKYCQRKSGSISSYMVCRGLFQWCSGHMYHMMISRFDSSRSTQEKLIELSFFVAAYFDQIRAPSQIRISDSQSGSAHDQSDRARTIISQLNHQL